MGGAISLETLVAFVVFEMLPVSMGGML